MDFDKETGERVNFSLFLLLNIIMKREVYMKKYTLKGLAEGLVGASTVQANSINDVFKKHPILSQIKDKVKIQGNTINAIVACDG